METAGGYMNREQSEELAEKLIESMDVIMRIRGSVFREELERSEVTFTQFHMLKMVGLHGGMTVSELARAMLVAPPTASRMIESLCSKGLLQREKDARDQRVTHVKITRSGTEVTRKIKEIHASILLELVDDEDQEELEAFTNMLDKFVARWSETSGRKG